MVLPMTEHSDALPREADRVTVEALSRHYRGGLLRYFARRGITAGDAEDAVQEVFAHLCRRGGLAQVAHQDGYLFQTAARVAVDHHRRGQARCAGAHVNHDDAPPIPDELSPERVCAGREELDLLLTVLRGLPERTRNIFLLARVESIRQAEIAHRLGISISTVEKHLVKALTELSERMGPVP